MKGDLHLHSYYSDGYCAPAEVMQKAAAAGCQIVSLTDHDALGGLAEARAEAVKLGLTFINGVELSCYYGMEVHILGYGIDDNDEFNGLIREQKQSRRDRSHKLLNNLRSYGINIDLSEFDFKVDREISRSHIAEAMVRLGYEPDFFTAMHKWLCYGAPTYVAHIGADPATAIKKIHSAGGKAVLAHPVRLNMPPTEKMQFIKYLAGLGLDGIEAVYKRSLRNAVNEFKRAAAELNLFVTAGADYHGDGNEIIPRVLSKATVNALCGK